jgi:SAM-dependent methyltransferase
MAPDAGIRDRVRRAYSAVATRPAGEHPFPVGRAFAESVGYPADRLRSLPAAAVDAFAGVSCVPAFAELHRGDRVLDLGCGAGLDSLLAAREVGPDGSVTAIDFSRAMLDRAGSAVREAGVTNIDFVAADAGDLPLPGASFDAVMANGIFNLNPDREGIFGELARVLHPGGWVFAAELVLTGPLPPETRASEVEWFR